MADPWESQTADHSAGRTAAKKADWSADYLVATTVARTAGLTVGLTAAAMVAWTVDPKVASTVERTAGSTAERTVDLSVVSKAVLTAALKAAHSDPMTVARTAAPLADQKAAS